MIKSITFFVMQIRVIFALPSLVPPPLVPWAAAPVAYPSIHHCTDHSPGKRVLNNLKTIRQ